MNITIKDLTYKNTDKTIFNKLSFDFFQKIYIIKGINGSGKTTLLNLIYEKNKKYKGTILINGQKITNIEKKRISYIKQDVFLLENMSVHQNMLLFLNSTEYEKVKTLITQFNDFSLKDKVKKLSGGQKKMLDFLIGISKEAEIFLIDEPFNNLSDKRIQFAINILMNINGIVLIVDHSNALDNEKNISKLIIKEGKLINCE